MHIILYTNSSWGSDGIILTMAGYELVYALVLRINPSHAQHPGYTLWKVLGSRFKAALTNRIDRANNVWYRVRGQIWHIKHEI
jgi:hypothetical protein